jgi:hypothetical protein
MYYSHVVTVAQVHHAIAGGRECWRGKSLLIGKLEPRNKRGVGLYHQVSKVARLYGAAEANSLRNEFFILSEIVGRQTAKDNN